MAISTPPPPIGPSGFTNKELGFAPPAPPPAGAMPPGDGAFSVPSFLSFSSLVTTAARSYLYTFDEALRDSPANARAMRRDAVLMGALVARQRPTAQLTWSIEPRDETDPAEAEAAKLVTELVEDIPRFQKMKMMLLEALWFGRSAVEIAYEWKEVRGRQVLTVRNFFPINGDKLRFKWDGTPGVLVYGGYPGTWEATDWGMAHFLTDPREREQYVIHEFEPYDSDWTEPQMAGSVHGVGIRGRLYWFWWMKQQVFALLMNYLERFSNGLTIFYYAAHDPAAKAEAAAAAAAQFNNTALLYPRWSTENPDVNKVERLEVGTASPALLQNLVTEYFDGIMVRFILGQTLSHTAEASGMGSGVADLQADTLSEIIKYDAVDLAETLQRDLIGVLYRYNAPGVRPGKFKFSIDAPNSQEVLSYAQILYDMGLSLDGDQLFELAQLTKPKPGGDIVSKISSMSPMAATGVPQGVPVAGGVGQPVPQHGMPPQGMMMPQQGVPQQMARNGKAAQASRSLPRRRLRVG